MRDIEVCLRAQVGKLYHMGIENRVSRSTLADANSSFRGKLLNRLVRLLPVNVIGGMCYTIYMYQSIIKSAFGRFTIPFQFTD